MPDPLRRILQRFAIPQLGLVLAIGQALVWVAWVGQGPEAQAAFLDRFVLDSGKVLDQGEWWRLFSVVFLPMNMNPLWLLFGLWFFWFMAAALEGRWGTLRFNLFLLAGWAALVGGAFAGHALYGAGTTLNVFWLGSVLLAFGWHFPDFRILLFFIIPVPVKWIALLAWIGYLVALARGPGAIRLMVAAAVAGVLLFCGRSMGQRLTRLGRRSAAAVAAVAVEGKAFHRCVDCGATELSHPGLGFRVCTDCRPAADVCSACLKEHDRRRHPGGGGPTAGSTPPASPAGA